MAGHMNFNQAYKNDFKKDIESVKKELLSLIEKYEKEGNSGKFKKEYFDGQEVMQLTQEYIENPSPNDKAYVIHYYKDLGNDWRGAGIEIHIKENGENQFFLVM